jgi:uncharacterized protein with GYD domain
MPKFLWQVSYTPDGQKGLIKEGASNRVATIKRLTESHGGTLETFYFAFGDDDAYLIAELPSNIEASAISLAVGASGAAHIKTVVLLTADDVDTATRIDVGYRAPGS